MTAIERKTKVIVADDERVIANTLCHILNHADFNAQSVYSGEEAVQALYEFRPDMLISDVIMAGLTGIEVAIKAREILPSCKILLFSGYAATSDLLRQARVEGHDVQILSKPAHPADLLMKLRFRWAREVIARTARTNLCSQVSRYTTDTLL